MLVYISSLVSTQKGSFFCYTIMLEGRSRTSYKKLGHYMMGFMSSRQYLFSYGLVFRRQAQDQVKGGLIPDVAVWQGPAILTLIAGEDQSPSVQRGALLVLYHGLDLLDRVGEFDLEGDGLSREVLHEALHATSQLKGLAVSIISPGER